MAALDEKTTVGAWEDVHPTVNAEAEFFEILNDFGDPLEVLREAISNAFDASATWVNIEFAVREIEGSKKLVLEISDNGTGMTKDILSRDFWGLGYSQSRDRDDAIGEKGHGTKIFLRSECVTARTQGPEGAFEAVCEDPLSALAQRRLHEPKIRRIRPFLKEGTGTEIAIIGYNCNERSKFISSVVRDYLLWFTKLGSVEKAMGKTPTRDFRVFLKCLDQDKSEPVLFGHVFPPESENIDKLFTEKGPIAADWYVKKYLFPNQRLRNHPEVTYDCVIYVEGDAVKRSYNPMICERKRTEGNRYRVADRYGIWLCRDFIPVQQANDWITGFGSGSNAFVLLHGFVNCQFLKLTANRGDIANTEPGILDELQGAVKEIVDKIDTDLHTNGLYTLKQWQEEERTLTTEKAEFERRVKNLRVRKVAKLGGRILVEPWNESELFGLFMAVYCTQPDLFEFEPLDYNTNRGIDIIGRNKSDNKITEGEHWYIELKHTLQPRFNHAFKFLRWIICWDFSDAIERDTEFRGIEDPDVRRLETASDDAEHTVYFLTNRAKAPRIQVIRMQEFLKERLGVEFERQK